MRLECNSRHGIVLCNYLFSHEVFFLLKSSWFWYAGLSNSFSRIMDISESFYELLSSGCVIKVTTTAMLVVGFLKFIKSLTERSPYDHIPGPKPSTMFGTSSGV